MSTTGVRKTARFSMKWQRMALILVLLVALLGLATIKKVPLNSSFLLRRLNSTQDLRGYDGAVMYVEGYVLRFPFNLYYVKGLATIHDHTLTIYGLNYSRTSSQYMMGLSRWYDDGAVTGIDSVTLEYWANSGHYFFGTPWGGYSATPVSGLNWGETLLKIKGIAGPDELAAHNRSRLLEEDLEKALQMSERFLRESYYAQNDPARINLSSYIVDPNLLKYSAKKVKEEVRPNFEIDGAEINISLLKSEYQGDRFFLRLLTEVKFANNSGFGEVTELLVKNSNGRLVIADWFTEVKPRSAFDRHRDPQGITNPTVWEDPEQVKNLFIKVGIE